MPRDQAGTLIAKILARPYKYKSPTLARLLRITRKEAVLMDSIRAFDVTEAEMAEERKKYKAAWNRANRAAKSSGRSPGRPKSGRPQQWKAAGAPSKSTYYY